MKPCTVGVQQVEWIPSVKATTTSLNLTTTVQGYSDNNSNSGFIFTQYLDLIASAG